MTNYIRIDAEGNRILTTLSFRDDGNNEIYVTVKNGENYGRILIFYGSVPKETYFIHINEREFLFKINPKYFTGKGLVHIQYNDSRMTEVIHILGCQRHPRELYLIKRTEMILSCVDQKESGEMEESELIPIVVKNLPDPKTAKAGRLYLVPKISGDNMDRYDEYQLIDEKWERFGPQIEDENLDFDKILPEE